MHKHNQHKQSENSALPTWEGAFYQDYVYSYPHKTTYRPFQKPKSLTDVWQDDDLERLFLYIHIPFCEMRCGFCNLFTTVNAKEDLVTHYLSALERQMETTAQMLPKVQATRLAIGGGTPTFLSPEQLNRLFSLSKTYFGADASLIPASIETSPATATQERLSVLAERGIERVSIGIQSFIEDEAKQIGRPQKNSQIKQALTAIKDNNFPILNIDLIYGAASQSVESWLYSLQSALEWQPEEIYLYPLYVRPLTGLDGKGHDGSSVSAWDQHRMRLYLAGRDFLQDQGYSQISMRMFKKDWSPTQQTKITPSKPDYCCQEDGMIGLGAGARSYSKNIHYSSEYAVKRAGVLSILEAYNQKTAQDFGQVEYGIDLVPHEQMVRYILKSILQTAGLDLKHFKARYNQSATALLPDLSRYIDKGYLAEVGGALVPTATGLALGDAIGPALYSAAMRSKMQEYQQK